MPVENAPIKCSLSTLRDLRGILTRGLIFVFGSFAPMQSGARKIDVGSWSLDCLIQLFEREQESYFRKHGDEIEVARNV